MLVVAWRTIRGSSREDREVEKWADDHANRTDPAGFASGLDPATSRLFLAFNALHSKIHNPTNKKDCEWAEYRVEANDEG